jgi:hypothetical protein
VIKPQPVVTPPADIGSLDATPSVSGLDVNGPLAGSVVRRAVDRVLPALRTCYKTAAKTAQKTPVVKLSISFEIDENSAATGVSVSGNFGTLAACARSAIGNLVTQQAPDVGTAHVVVGVAFKPL